MPLFSIIIPAYNVAPYIAATVESVLMQTERDFELLVIDDGSTDATPDILKEFHDSRMRIIRQENAGVSVARNRGIQEAQGKYVCFLDGDDLWSPIHLEAARIFFEKHPDISWYTGFYSTEQSHLITSLNRISNYRIVSFFEESASQPHSSGVCLLRSLITSELFPPGIRYAEDLIAWTRIACLQPFYGLLEKPTIFYRPRSNSAMHSRPHPRACEREHGRIVYGIYNELKLPDSCSRHAKRLMHMRFVERWRHIIEQTTLSGYTQEVNERKRYTGFIVSCWVRLFLVSLSILVFIFEKPLSTYLRLRRKFKL